jgi:N-acetylneuraminic acid mutarotase
MKKNIFLIIAFAGMTLTTQVARSQCEGDVWASKADMLTRGVGVATCTVNGKLYAFGAGWGAGVSPNAVQEYDPATDTWSARADMPTERAWITASAVNGKCYVIGGGKPFVMDALRTVEEYDPSTDSWRTRAPLPEGRSAASSVAVDGKIYVMGGSDTVSFTPNEIRSSVVIYDPATNQWSTGADMPTPRDGMASEFLDGFIYTIGGSNPPAGIDFSNKVERYNPATDQWMTRARLPENVAWASASVYNGILYTFGGLFSFSFVGTTSAAVHGYDPTSNQWVRYTDMGGGRYGHSSEAIGAKILVIGGRRLTESAALGVTEEYTPCNVDDPPPFTINAGHAGAWYNSETSGQGQLIDVVPEDQFMFLAWFTFTDAASNNPNQQHWYTAQGDYSGNSTELVLSETLGGQFDDPQETSTNPVGTVTVSFSDCEQGQIAYSIDTDGREGTIPLERLIPGSGDVCEEQSGTAAITTEAVDINAGMDGTWVNPDTLGQGFLIDAHPNPDGSNFIFVAWFTYGDDTASGQRWLTAQGDFVGSSTAEIPIHETTSGSFNTAQLVGVNQVGTMTIDFTDCSNAQLSYTLTDDGIDGDMVISRLIPGGQALCEELAGAE